MDDGRVSDHPTPHGDGATSIGMQEKPVTVQNVEGVLNIGSNVSINHVHQHRHKHVIYVINNCRDAFAPDRAEEVFVDQCLFLQRIKAGFLTEVKPQESGLLDRLRKADVIDSNCEARVTSCATSWMQADCLFEMLMQVPPQVFAEKCMPILSLLYPHILDGTTFAFGLKEDLCVRHFVMLRTSAVRFADVLVSTCSVEEYSRIIESSVPEETKWERIFQTLNSMKTDLDSARGTQETGWKSGTDRMVELLRQALKNEGQTVPDNFHDLVSQGLHCKCEQAPDSPAGEQVDRQNGCLGLLTSEKEGREGSFASKMSAMWGQRNQGVQDDRNELNSCFERSMVVTIMENLNKGIKTASLVKPAALELEGILDIVKILTLTNPALTKLTNGPENVDAGKVARLRGRAKELHSSLSLHFKQASEDYGEIKAFLAKGSSLSSCQKYVQGRVLVLENELNEALDLVSKSEMVMEKLESCMSSRFQLMSS